MRRIVLIAIIFIVLTLSVIAVYDNYVDVSKVYKTDIRGIVTNVSIFGETATILVEVQKEDDTSYDKASVRIDKKTLITKTLYDRPIDLSEITVGDKVEITFTGPVAESYPVQALAKLVNITEEE